MEEAITQLLQNGCVRELKQPPTCVNPLTVAIGKKLRLVIDLRHVNACLVKPKFRYEDLRSLSKVFQRGFWFVTWDLKSGYHHVDIYEPHQTYLGFAWPYLGTQRYFAFTVLPFGLSTTCNCFIKLLRPLLHRWRLLNFNCFLYLDDGISGHPDKVSASAASLVHQKDLDSSGFVVNQEKSNWLPRLIGEWLGLIINTIQMVFQVPASKTSKLKKLLGDAILTRKCTFRDIAKFAGFINSLFLAVGPIARLFTRQMYFTINSRHSWDSSIVISGALLKEMQFWIQNIDAFNGFPIRRPVAAAVSVFTDASDYAFGGYSIAQDLAPVSGMFSAFEQNQSSTFRELKAIFYVLTAYRNNLMHKSVKVFTDSQCAERIVAVGSPKPHLQSVAIDIFNLCLRSDIQIATQWIPREGNEKADLLSRFIDKDDCRQP